MAGGSATHPPATRSGKMDAGEKEKRARLGRITVAAAVLAVLLVILTGLTLGGAGSTRGSSPGQSANSGLVLSLPATTAINLNESQVPGCPGSTCLLGAGTYVHEYVLVNNASTLTKLPAVLTVAASACDWVAVANFTAPAIPVSVFHNVQFHNVTSLNDTGNLADLGKGFKVCGGTQVWLNYVYWTYSIYGFVSTGIGVNTTVTLGGFSDWAGTTIQSSANVTANIGPHAVAAFTVSSNLTFTAVFVKTVDGPTSCDATGQVCSFDRYSFVSASDTANVTKSTTLAFTVVSGLRVIAAYENWTVGYSTTSVSANTALGGFFQGADGLFQEVFVQFWFLWILGLLVVALIAATMRNKRGRRR